MSREELQSKQNVTDLPVLLSDLPSVIFYSDNANGVGYNYLSMRGFDQRRIAVLINGIPQNDPEDHNVYWIDFPDLSSSVEDIQVQRGAGLISYGAAAIGGSINLRTLDISKRAFSRLSVGAGMQEHAASGLNAAPDNISTWASSRSSFEVCTGLDSHHDAFYARLSQISSRGYRDYSWSTLQSFFVSAGRFEDNYSVQLNVFGGPITDGLAYTGMPKSFITDPSLRRSNDNYWSYDSTGSNVDYRAARRPQETEEFSQPHAELLVNADISDNVSISSSIFAYTGLGYFDYDGSWADAATLRLTAAFGGSDSITNPGNAMIRAWVKNAQVGWIPQLRWRHAGGELYVGGELRVHRSEHWANISYAENLPAGFDPDFRIYSYEGRRQISSVFAREVYGVTHDLNLSLEAQVCSSSYGISNEKAGKVYTSYEQTNGSTVGNGADLFTVTYLFVNPRIGLSWRLNNENELYTSIAQTQREPRMANLYAAEESFYSGAGPLFAGDTVNGTQRYNFSQPLIKPETMLDLELGWRMREKNLSLAATLFMMDFHDELVANGARDLFGNPITGNAPHSRHSGVELEAATTLWSSGGDAFSVHANMTYCHNRILSYTYQLPDTTIDLANNPISGFPDIIANIGLNLQLSDLVCSLSMKTTSKIYSDNFGDNVAALHAIDPANIDYVDNVVDGATVFNASLAYTIRNLCGMQSLRVHAQVSNLFNTLYAAGANGKEFFPAAERNWFVGIDLEP